MPLTPLQTRTLRLLADRRSAASYVAGSTPLNAQAGRYSRDVAIFNDEAGAVAAIALADLDHLAANGLSTDLRREARTFHSAIVSDGTETLQLDWAEESDFRFFSAVPDPLFGFRLHMADLAANKLLAAADRRAVRDAVDLLTIHRTILPLGALAWAAAEKDPGLTEPLSAAELNLGLRAALQEAEAFLEALPPLFQDVGLLSR